MEDTIAAISTPAGTGAIAMIRLSGPEARKIAGLIFSAPPVGKGAASFKSGRIHYGWIRDHDRTIDEVVVTAYQSPKSYTGEDMIEISCHGSAYIQKEILNLLIRMGARMAQPGEFTRRAYLNHKMDLSQAEAVADLIAASGQASHRLAMDQLRGGISDELNRIRGELLDFVALIELELDFSEEDVEFVDRSRLKALLDIILEHFDRLIRSFELGNAIKSGVPVAIAGESNVGKSTLLNALLKEDKAIVSEIAGTTRDVIEDTIHIGGIEFRFIDTAGIRETHDSIETLGIERAYHQIEKARIVLLMTDVTAPAEQSLAWIEKINTHIREDQNLIILLNKADLNAGTTPSLTETTLKSSLITHHSSLITLSAKTGTGLDRLEEVLLELVNINSLEDNDIVITNARHYEALVHARTALYRTLNGLHSGTSGDFLAQDIREALHHLESITGAISSEEILGTIFSRFCIGK